MASEVFNPNPTIITTVGPTARKRAAQARHSLWLSDDEDSTTTYDSDDEPEPIDADEVFDLIRSISDPEHRSMTLEQLAVVSAPQVTVAPSRILVEFTPTVPHCGMSTLIGLSIRVRLLRALPTRFKVDIRVKPGSHQSEHAVNKQLNDKERVAAALENPALVEVLETCLQNAGRHGL
ncbi:FAM96B protein [Lactifluus subvellereus]|nr:FAM96B protein [Lactifluus subvellereus]